MVVAFFGFLAFVIMANDIHHNVTTTISEYDRERECQKETIAIYARVEDMKTCKTIKNDEKENHDIEPFAKN